MSLFPKILVLATSRHSHGGISSVVCAHEQTKEWKEHKCHWISTHRSGHMATKMLYLMQGMLCFLCLLPWCKAVHAHIGEAPSARRKKIFINLARLFGKKIIVHLHAFSIESTIDGSYGHVYQNLFDKADKVIVLSEFWKNSIATKISDIRKIKILNNPCPKINLNTSYPKENIILSAGVISPRKGYADLINAFAQIAYKHPEWKLVFAGSGEIEQGKALANKLGIGKTTQFIGWVSGDDKDNIFKRTSILCLPSYAEGFPMAVLDAWAYGIPVIATTVGSLPDVAGHGEDILFFTPGDIKTLSMLLEKLIEDSDLRQKLAQASIRFAEKDFNLHTIGLKLGDIYNEIIQ